MDVIQNHSVKIPNAVLVRGITGTEKDEEILDFLKQYGSINRVIPVEHSSSEFYPSLVVEYNLGHAVEALVPELPYAHGGGDGFTYEIQTLSSVYSQTIVSNTTRTCITELKDAAKLSGKDFTEVLKDMMSQISQSIATLPNTTPHTDSTLASPKLGGVKINAHFSDASTLAKARSTYSMNSPCSPAQPIRPLNVTSRCRACCEKGRQWPADADLPQASCLFWQKPQTHT